MRGVAAAWVLVALGGCARRPAVNAAADGAAPPPAHVALRRSFAVGLLAYQVDRVSALRQMPRTPAPLSPPAGSVFVLAEFSRTWNGSSGITLPAGPLELVTAAGQRLQPDADGTAAQILRTNCGDLGPARLDPGVVTRTCEVFVVPEAALTGLALQPSAAAHRGDSMARPLVDVGPLVAPAGP